MNRFFSKKSLAFTLAEMMVVLGLFSVISAATLPVITARQQMPGGSSAGTEGSAEDPWVANTAHNSLTYYDNSMPKTFAVMVGGDVSASPSSLGYPQLIVKDNVGTGDDDLDASQNGILDASQIILLKRNNSNPYYAGRIMFGNSDYQSYGSIALGANALSYETKNGVRIYNVAIGSNAMASDGQPVSKSYSIAIGSKSFYSGDTVTNSVAVGNYAGYNIGANRSVIVGNYAGADQKSVTSNFPFATNSVLIGDKAGSWKTRSGTLKDVVAIGTYAGYNEQADKSVFMGTYAGSYIGIGTSSTDESKTETVAIGYYAGARLTNYSNKNGGVAIGTYAGYDSHLYGVYVGSQAGYGSSAGYSIMFGDRAGYYANSEMIALGTFAGHGARVKSTNKNVPVYIGYYAGYYANTRGETIDYAPAVVMGSKAGYNAYGNLSNAIFIGTKAGYAASNLAYAVCIGKYACAGNSSSAMNHIVRINLRGGYWTGANSQSAYAVSTIGDIPTSLTSNAGSSVDNLLITPLYGTYTNTTNSSIVFYGKVFSKNTSFSAISDRRLKENIRPAEYGLNEIKKINVYNYNWKKEKNGKVQLGVMAQDLQKVIPEAVHKNKNGYLTVESTWIIYTSVNAIKEIDLKVNNLRKRLVSYTKEYVSLVERVNKLEKEIKVLEKENKTLVNNVQVAYKKAKKAENKR